MVCASTCLVVWLSLDGVCRLSCIKLLSITKRRMSFVVFLLSAVRSGMMEIPRPKRSVLVREIFLFGSFVQLGFCQKGKISRSFGLIMLFLNTDFLIHGFRYTCVLSLVILVQNVFLLSFEFQISVYFLVLSRHIHLELYILLTHV